MLIPVKRALCAQSFILVAIAAAHGAVFRVEIDPAASAGPCTGRLVVYLINDNAQGSLGSVPADAPFFENPQPMFGIDIQNLKAGDAFTVDDGATAFPVKPSALPAGKYMVQAVLDMHQDNSRWDREPGNLFSVPVHIEVGADPKSIVDLKLTKVVQPRKLPEVQGVELFEIESKLLSEFHHRPIKLRAGVVLPTDYDPKRAYPAIYEIPGFGGDASDAFRRSARGGRQQLSNEAFWIVLDPESGNGHTLFANSDNNGPCGDALVRELIPALEKKFSLMAKPQARLLRGHSSGGWSALWLVLQYPETFGGAWPSSPDPVDFHKLQLVDIYSVANMYSDGTKDWPSVRSGNMTIRQENAMEQVLGPANTSGQQWDSWQGVWGSRDGAGRIAPLYDPVSGVIDHAEAQKYQRYDIDALLTRDPKKYGPIFKERVHLMVGGADTFFLNEAVALLKPDVDSLPGEGGGYIKILPGLDHGSIHASPEFQAIPQEMLEQLHKLSS